MKKYEIDGHTIYHGDAIDILRSEVKDSSVDLIFVDPPYNIGKNSPILKTVGLQAPHMLNGLISGLTSVLGF